MYNDIDDYLLKCEEDLEISNSSLDNWEEKTLTKIEKILKFIKVLDYQNNTIDSEIKRLQDLKKSNIKKIDNLKNYILMFVDKPLNIGTYRISTRNSESVNILDEDKVPEEFKETKITKTISKTKIKEFLDKNSINPETGEVYKPDCDWAEIVYKKNLIIK